MEILKKYHRAKKRKKERVDKQNYRTMQTDDDGNLGSHFLSSVCMSTLR